MVPIYVGSTVEFSGKHFVALAMGLTFKDEGLKMGHFKPYGMSPVRNETELLDMDAKFFCESLEIDDPMENVCPVIVTENFVTNMLTKGITDHSEEIISAYKKVSAGKDVMVIGGVSHICCGSIVGMTEHEFIKKTNANTILATTIKEMAGSLDDLLFVKDHLGDNFKGVIFNRIPIGRIDWVEKLVRPFMESKGIGVYGVIPNDPVLGSLPIGNIVEELGGTVLTGDDMMEECVERFMIGAMNVSSALKHFRKVPNKAVITGGDRSDIQLAAIETSTKCLLLTGGMYPNPTILTKAENSGVAVIVLPLDTASVVERCETLMGHISLRTPKKLSQAREIFSKGVDFSRLKDDCGLK